MTTDPADDGQPLVRAQLAMVLAGPTVVDASCRQLAPEWDTRIDGEDGTVREARIQLARRICRRCPGLARCLELLEELDQSDHPPAGVVLAGEVRGPRGEVLQRRWALADAPSSDAAPGAGPHHPRRTPPMSAGSTRAAICAALQHAQPDTEITIRTLGGQAVVGTVVRDSDRDRLVVTTSTAVTTVPMDTVDTIAIPTEA